MDKQKIVQRYAAVFGRAPAVIRDSVAGHSILACCFPALARSFWKGLFAEAHDVHVWITAGLSGHKIEKSSEGDVLPSVAFELMAMAEHAVGGGETGVEDVITVILQMIAGYIIEQGVVVEIGHTLDFREPMSANTEMTGVFFLPPDGIDMKRLIKCSSAEEILGVMPLTAAELEFARTDGVGALIDKFEEAGVSSFFDVFRKSVI